MSLLNGLMDAFDDNAINNMSNQIGASQSQTKTALGSLLPILLNSVSKQGSTESSGLGSFVGFLDADKDGSILDDVAGFVLSGRDGNSGNILSSLLGGNQQQIEGYVSDDSGLSSQATSKLMQLAAPVVISYLARRNKQTESSTGLGDLLGGFLGEMNEKAPQSSSVIDQLLDNNKNKVDNDIANLGGSLLGSLFR